MKERIISLIQSPIWEDVLIGIELAYKLDLQTFKSILDNIYLNCKYPGNMYFIRENEAYVIGYHTIFQWPIPSMVLEDHKDITPNI